jgi:hypothetical protein
MVFIVGLVIALVAVTVIAFVVTIFCYIVEGGGRNFPPT